MSNNLNSTIGKTWNRKSEEKAKIACGGLILESLSKKEEKKINWLHLIWVLIALVIILSLIGTARAETGTVSWFSNVETNGRSCADGRYHDLASEYVIASWNFPLNTLVRVTTMDGHSIICRTVDHGPGRRDGTSRYYKGRRIADLSKAVFALLSPSGTTKEGLLKVSVTKIKEI